MGEQSFTDMAAATTDLDVPSIGVGVLGYSFMGKAHSNALKTLPYMIYPPPAIPELVAICGRDAGAVAEAARRYGYARHYTDWRDLIDDERVQLFDNGGPNDVHAEPCIAAAAAGKHVICEKPLARNAEEAATMLAAVRNAGVKHMVAFNYRFVPAIRQARQLIESGALGRIYHYRAVYLQEWILPHYGTPRIWRLDKEHAGSGALGDLGAHIIDLAHYLVGDIASVGAATRTFIDERPLPDGSGNAKVDVDDCLRCHRGIRQRSSGNARIVALCGRPQESPGRRDQRRAWQHLLQPRTPQRAPGVLGRRRASRDAGLPRCTGNRSTPPVLGTLVASRTHHRLGAHVRTRVRSPARLHRQRSRCHAPRGDLRGRLSRPPWCVTPCCHQPPHADRSTWTTARSRSRPMYLLGYDVGSSSVKAALLEADTGACVASASSPADEMAIDATRPGYAEQHPELWWRHLVRATAAVLEGAAVRADHVGAIGIAYQMHGLVLVNEQGAVLRPAIIWCDSRAVTLGEDALESLGFDYCQRYLLNSPGNFTASKLAWVKAYEPDIFARVYKMMLPGDWIAMRMTGAISTTVSGLSEGILWDFVNDQISSPLLRHFELDDSLLPDVVPTFGAQGSLTRAAASELGLEAGVPVSYRAGDQPNNALSLDVFEPGEIAATAGTSGVVYGVSDVAQPDARWRVNNIRPPEPRKQRTAARCAAVHQRRRHSQRLASATSVLLGN